PRSATRSRDPHAAGLLGCLQELVRFRSDRPEDRRKIARWAEARLRAMGARVTRHGSPDSPALLASFGEGGVLFSGHLDTVPMTGAWRTRPAEIRGDKLFGRGSSDMKGGVAAILMAASELRGRVPFSIALTTDEETTMAGAKSMLGTPALRRSTAIVV